MVATDFGWAQLRAYNQPDLYHEEVAEVASPFDLVVSSGTVCVRTLLLLGDQNAGKTTFLHCFADVDDDGFTRLTSALPVLQASFLNSRFLPEGSPMDELPFLDTDIARSTVLVGMDDWNFVLEEHGLPPESSRCACMCLQLLEIGGDHLDRIMHPDRVRDERLRRVCEQSLRLLRCADKVAYVLNGADLARRCKVASDVCDALQLTRERLAFVREQNAAIEVAVLLSRETGSDQREWIARQLRTEVWPFAVLDPSSGRLAAEGIVEALCRLVKLEHFVATDAAAMAAEQLVSLWHGLRTCAHSHRTAAAAPLPLWLTARELHALHSECEAHGNEDEHGSTAAPVAHLLSQFDGAVAVLAEKRVALRRFGALTSRLAIQFGTGEDALTWAAAPVAEKECACRFPAFEPLYDALLADKRGVAIAFWGASNVPHSVVVQLEDRVAEAFAAGNIELFLLLADEWQLVCDAAIFPRSLSRAVLEKRFVEQMQLQLSPAPDGVRLIRFRLE